MNKQDESKAKPQPQSLRSAFCQGDERAIKSAAQVAADRECRHPAQAKPLPHEPFEPHGMN
jgi:hypothetical protein